MTRKIHNHFWTFHVAHRDEERRRKKIKQKHSFLSLLTHNYCWSNSSWCSSSSYYTRWTHSLFFYFRSHKVLFLLLEKWKECFCCVYPMKPVTLEILFDDEKIQNLKQLILGNIIAIFCNNFFCEKSSSLGFQKKTFFTSKSLTYTIKFSLMDKKWGRERERERQRVSKQTNRH